MGFFEPCGTLDEIGLGDKWLYYDSQSDARLGATVPGTGTAGDIFMQAMYPLHSGGIAGMPGRILVSALGLCVAALSVTGVMIWARKRRARRSGRHGGEFGLTAASEQAP